jgi:DNA-binding IclR family transcriptional regulator
LYALVWNRCYAIGSGHQAKLGIRQLEHTQLTARCQLTSSTCTCAMPQRSDATVVAAQQIHTAYSNPPTHKLCDPQCNHCVNIHNHGKSGS